MTDNELRSALARLHSGDREALAEIYDALSTPLYTIALRITGRRDTAEDAVQELFLKLQTSLPPKELQKPRAYLFKAARNAALDILRRTPVHENVEDYTQLPAQETVQISDVEEALESLPEQQRSIVTIHINAGLKFREIAEITETPLGTVLWRYNKALATLRDILNGGIS